MKFTRTPPDEMIRRQRSWNRDHRPAKPLEPSTINGDTAASLLDQRGYVFRGRAYRVPPIPWKHAMCILDAHLRLPELQNSRDPLKVGEVFDDAIRRAKDIMRPVGWFRSLLWPITPNPFRNASPLEVGALLGFFWMCVMMDAGQSLEGILATLPGTSRPPSPPSSTDTLPGSVRTASRSPGRTSSSAVAGQPTKRRS